MLNPATGEVIADLPTKVGSTPVGTVANPSGLAQIAAYNAGTSSTPLTTYAYGGDLLGNVWKFDLSGATPSSWTVTRIASLQDSSNSPQPITSTPELSTKNGKIAVYIGTGRLLGSSDKTDTQTQSFYMILDKGTELLGNARNSLTSQIVTVGSGGVRTVTRNMVNLSVMSGWYLDLPAGEKMNVDPQLSFGMVVFNTNAPSSTACSSASYSYAIDQNTGGMMPRNYFSMGSEWAGKSIGNVISSRPVLAVVPNGRVISIDHTSDNNVVTNQLIGSTNRTIRKVGWRELRF